MTKTEVEQALPFLYNANLSGANLRGANLRGANLRGADLSSADLRGADLHGANLPGANLRDADLSDALLSGANLRGADLRDADLPDANLRDADLSSADLRGADLSGADLHHASLPCAPSLLQCAWSTVSDSLCTELMRYDASNHPRPELFDIWAAGGDCPMSVNWERAANFIENRKLWSSGPSLSALQLVTLLFAEKGIKR